MRSARSHNRCKVYNIEKQWVEDNKGVLVFDVKSVYNV